MTDAGIASTGGVVRLLETEPTQEERYAHAFALLALLKPTSGPRATQTSQTEKRLSNASDVTHTERVEEFRARREVH